MTDRKKKSPLENEADIEKDWTKGSIVRNLLLLSWPMVVLEGLYMAGILPGHPGLCRFGVQVHLQAAILGKILGSYDCPEHLSLGSLGEL